MDFVGVKWRKQMDIGHVVVEWVSTSETIKIVNFLSFMGFDCPSSVEFGDLLTTRSQ